MDLANILKTRSIPVLDLSALLAQLSADTEIKLGDLTFSKMALIKALGGAEVAKQRRLTSEERAAIAKEPKGVSLQALAVKYGTSAQTIKKHR